MNRANKEEIKHLIEDTVLLVVFMSFVWAVIHV